jgi:hypothetical protein
VTCANNTEFSISGAQVAIGAVRSTRPGGEDMALNVAVLDPATHANPAAPSADANPAAPSADAKTAAPSADAKTAADSAAGESRKRARSDDDDDNDGRGDPEPHTCPPCAAFDLCGVSARTVWFRIAAAAGQAPSLAALAPLLLDVRVSATSVSTGLAVTRVVSARIGVFEASPFATAVSLAEPRVGGAAAAQSTTVATAATDATAAAVAAGSPVIRALADPVLFRRALAVPAARGVAVGDVYAVPAVGPTATVAVVDLGTADGRCRSATNDKTDSISDSKTDSKTDSRTDSISDSKTDNVPDGEARQPGSPARAAWLVELRGATLDHLHALAAELDLPPGTAAPPLRGLASWTIDARPDPPAH